MRSKLVILLGIIVLLVGYISYILGIMDYFGIRKNHFNVKVDNVNIEVLYISGRDTLLLYKDGKILNRLPDLYGEDYLLVKTPCSETRTTFDNFKLKSYLKAKYFLKVNPENTDELLWELSTLNDKTKGNISLESCLD